MRRRRDGANERDGSVDCASAYNGPDSVPTRVRRRAPDDRSVAKPASARILIVEDDGPLLEVLRYVLEDEGYEVLTAEDGPAALKLAQANPVDLVLLDIGMTTMSGFEVAQSLRDNAATAAIPIAFHTGMTEDAVRARFADFDLFLAKGDDAQRLVDAIAAITGVGAQRGASGS